MIKSEKRCSHCGGKYGLIFYFHWGLRFCRQACKDSFIAKAAEGCAHLRKRFGFEARILSRNS
jgi:hypothetical protein